MISQSFVIKHKGEEVNVTMEFPEQTDKTAEQEFISRLKAICLENYGMNTLRGKAHE